MQKNYYKPFSNKIAKNVIVARSKFAMLLLALVLLLAGCGKSKHDMCIAIVEGQAAKADEFLGGKVKIPKAFKSGFYDSCMSKPIEQVKSQYEALRKNPYR